MKPFPEDISVAVIAHNAEECITRTLEALKEDQCPQEQIMVLDVASTDLTPNLVRRRWPRVDLVRLESNEGPNPARNLAIIRARQPYILLLDSDVRVERGAVSFLREEMERDSSIGIASPLVLFENGSDVIQYADTWIHYIGEAINRCQGSNATERGSRPHEIGCASGNALLLRRDAAMEIGLFDEHYFFGKDDGDFTHRVRLAGYKILEVPRARVKHKAGERKTSWFTLQLRNRWYFILKNYQLRTIILTLPVLFLHEVFSIGLLICKGHGLVYPKALLRLMKLIPDMARERKRINAIRRVNDWEVMQADPIVMRGDFLESRVLRRIKETYDAFLLQYWTLLRRTFLK